MNSSENCPSILYAGANWVIKFCYVKNTMCGINFSLVLMFIYIYLCSIS